ncbi:MAG: methyltransferase domain-containing protein [Proteobacteria bacterium]|nr:methyltransferase domain-containing protein [Pseudomonadota bacterium]MBU1739426.1 methyltransferase domain-containing protein [Pseudomonadota bacterium]
MAISGNVNRRFEHKEGLAAYFSTQSDAWRKNYDRNHSGELSLYKRDIIKRKETVLHLLDKHASGGSLDILDIGCGAGILMKDMLQRGHKVVGSDISEEMLEEARKNTAAFPPARKMIVPGDLENISFADRTFDFVTCVGVLEYQKSDQTSVREISRVLKDGGFAIVTLPNLLRFKNILDPYYHIKLLPRVLRKLRWKAKPGHSDLVGSFERNENLTNRKFYYGQLNHLFRSSNLKIVDYVSIGYSPLVTVWRRSILPKAMAVRVGSYLEHKASSRPSLLKWIPNRWVICVQKTAN